MVAAAVATHCIRSWVAGGLDWWNGGDAVLIGTGNAWHTNTGGGGGAGHEAASGGGGSGIVIIRYTI